MNIQLTDREIAAKALQHLERIVRIDSASDESSETIPSTPGQARLAADVGSFFGELGATVETDDYANVLATFPGRGAGVDHAPIALMVHLDTARGTVAVDDLTVVEGWDGTPLRYSENPRLEVSTAVYPSLCQFVGHDVVHGRGDAPFGLDDKLGLTHLMTLAWLLRQSPEVDHPPLILVGRPDEEIGRMAAVEGLAVKLAERGVRLGYTIDGIEPFEINVENFNAAHAQIYFDGRALEAQGAGYRIEMYGVNTHGATAKAEGHRGAVRLAAELLAAGGDAVTAAAFVSDEVRDCDGVLLCTTTLSQAELERLVEEIVAPHRARGAGAKVDPWTPPTSIDGAAADALSFVNRFMASAPGFVLLAEDSAGHEGYSQPYRLVPEEGGVRLDVRLRDFVPAMLARRRAHVRAMAGGRAARLVDQYVNMGPRLAEAEELVSWASRAAESMGMAPLLMPIRGGTGVDPFLDNGVSIGNLGTGYFAPESEKELTSLQTMAAHARWLLALVHHAATTDL